MKNVRGFTLIEVMIVLAILGVIAVFAMPSITAVIQNNRITSETNRLVSNINMARSEATKRSTQITIARTSAANNTWEGGWSIYTDADAAGNSIFAAGDTLLRVADAASTGITIRSDATANAWLSLRPNGTLNEGGTNSVIYAICDSRGEAFGRLVTVNLIGRATSSATGIVDCTP